jgi:signal transduction histidine kinase
VQDVGCGLKFDDSERVFEAFYTTKHSGTGIGLSVSRTIIESHNGRIWWTPNGDGPGSTFSFTIPHIAATDAAASDQALRLVSDRRLNAVQ